MKTHYSERVKLLSILGLVLAVIISGCVGGGGGQRIFNLGEDALKVNIDTEGRSSFDSLEPFTITVTAENTGKFDVSNVASRLQGYDGITSTETPRALLSDLRDLSPSMLDRPQPDKKVAGGTGTIDWDVAAPFVPVDSPDREIILTGEVTYDTKSLATQRVVAATRTHIENLQARGESLPTMPETDAVNGPVSIDVEIPLPYVKVIGQKNEFPVRIHLNNDGSGTLLNKDISEYDYLGKVILKVPPGLGIDTANCDLKLLGNNDLGAERTLTVDLQNNREKLRLLQGGATRDLNCKLYVDSDYVTGYNTFDLSISTYYTYIQDISKSLVIKGTAQAPLKVKILSFDAVSTCRSNCKWDRGSTQTVKFEALYQNIPIKTGLNTTSVEFSIDGTQLAANQKVSLTYDQGEELWRLVINVPNMGNNNGVPFDGILSAKYQGETGTDTVKSGIRYCTNIQTC